jgi:hypothetical protein
MRIDKVDNRGVVCNVYARRLLKATEYRGEVTVNGDRVWVGEWVAQRWLAEQHCERAARDQWLRLGARGPTLH